MLKQEARPKGCQSRALWQLSSLWKYLCQTLMNELTSSEVRRPHRSSPMFLTHLSLSFPAFSLLTASVSTFYLFLCDRFLTQTNQRHKLSDFSTWLKLTFIFPYTVWHTAEIHLISLYKKGFPFFSSCFFLSSHRAENHAAGPGLLSPHSDRCQHVAWSQSTKVCAQIEELWCLRMSNS